MQNYTDFHLEIYNNAPNSDGNDFAIDDVRIYRKLVHASARQANSLCEDANTISVRMNYDELLSVLALKQGDDVPESLQPSNEYDNLLGKLQNIGDKYKDGNLSRYRKVQYYIFGVDNKWKENLQTWAEGKGIDVEDIIGNDQELVKGKGDDDALYLNMELVRKIQALADEVEGPLAPDNQPLGNCFRYAQLYYYNDEGYEANTSNHGFCVISTDQALMNENATDNVLAAYDGENVIFQNLRLPANTPSRRYYLIYIPSESAAQGGNLASFDDDCGIYAPFRLEKAADLVTVVDKGNTTVDINDIKADGTYTLAGHFTAKEENSDALIEVENATFDWFFGSYDDFMNPAKGIQKDPNDPSSWISIHEALTEYHGNKADLQDHNKGYLTKLKELFGDNNVIEVGGDSSFDSEKAISDGTKLVLHAKKITITTPADFTNQLLVVTPNPLGEYTDPDETTMYCINPREVALGGKTTVIPGDPDLTEYPKDHTLGIRLGMGQITDMVGEETKKQLQIPLYMVKPNSTEQQKNLGYRLADNVKIKAYSSDPDWETENNVVAEIKELHVEHANDLEWDDDYFQLQFNENALSFKEGYEYMLEVPYAEDVRVTGTDEDGNLIEVNKTLTGTFNVILKIVPEYVTWQGAADGNHNWNNDDQDHWKRSTAAELYDTDGTRAEKYNGGEDGTHYDNAYTPMRFTNVIIQNEDAYSAYPYLYELEVKDEESLPILNMKTDNATIGDATEYIEYDLAVDEKYMKILFGDGCDNTNDDIYTCVRFYGNTCKDIYFKPQTALLHAEHLTYEKAWIDYELDANRWYTLASPLKGVVAGDMYLPSGQVNTGDETNYAVQKLPAFEDITYDKTNGTRWDPAVYMRGWDKSGTDAVVTLDNNGINYAIAGSWSNLYNKVDESFTPATGFSVGVDVKSDKLTDNKVLFRLPKADKKYEYYGSGDVDGGDEKDINRENSGRLVTDELSEASFPISTSEASFVLVGNPFMAHLDMTKFFGENTIDKKYYILTENGTISNILGNDFSVSTGADDPTKVAPLQSFLVDKASLPTGFTTDMQTFAEKGGPVLRSVIASEPKNKLPEIRITAERDGKRNTAVVAYFSYASESYKEDEDASLLIDKETAAPLVYTLADKQMLAINLTDRVHDIPVGIYGTDKSPVTLTFHVSDRFESVTLLDKQEKKNYPVNEGMTLTVTGNTSGRYFLNGSTPTANEVIARNEIVCYGSGNGQIVVSSVDPLTRITVYDLSGKLVTGLTHLHTPTAYVQGLTPGQLYIVRAETANQVQTDKVEVR
ncbi:MAG: T9SS type A sorting domain-containing protein [Parabacteroides sp.]|nr:T9SS type A sorting domain-containing protein [Parabacteroides sp.]